MKGFRDGAPGVELMRRGFEDKAIKESRGWVEDKIEGFIMDMGEENYANDTGVVRECREIEKGRGRRELMRWSSGKLAGLSGVA